MAYISFSLLWLFNANIIQILVFSGMITTTLIITILAMTQVQCSLDNVSKQLSAQTFNHTYSLTATNGLNLDCLKAISIQNNELLGVFHSSKEEQASGYNKLYLGETTQQKWKTVISLSQRGSQGTLYQLLNSPSWLVLYQLQNHEHGNVIAIRYYQSVSMLRKNQYLYEYQLNQVISKQNVRNIGTPSVEAVILINQDITSKYNEYELQIKFHFSPDGQHDLPGEGYVHLIPLRDFIKQKIWIGGSKENYSDWTGSQDNKALNALRAVGFMGKIGQRDRFQITENGLIKVYYIYQCNLNASFDWKNWRIALYSPTESKAISVPFNFDGIIDLANPHISLVSKQNNSYTFWISFFIPSEGVPKMIPTPGEFSAIVKINSS